MTHLAALALTAISWTPALVVAQDPAPTEPPQQPAEQTEPSEPEAQVQERAAARTASERTEIALKALLKQVKAARDAERVALAELNEGDPSPAALERYEQAKTALQESIWRFDSVVSSLDVKEHHQPADATFSIASELESLLRPLLRELKGLTEEPRTIDHLRSQISDHKQHIDEAALGVRNVERTLRELAPDSSLREETEKARDRWREEIVRRTDEIAILEARLESLMESRSSFVDGARDLLQGFFRHRGRNLALALAVCIGVLLGLRFLQRRAQALPIMRRRALLSRALGVALHLFVTFAAIVATLLTLYLAGDWLLLAIALVFLLGAGWILMKTLPNYLEQLHLLLNLGAVREGERVVFEGVPYRVKALRVYSELINPALQGGNLRVPIRDLLPLRSRQEHPHEPWFPTRPGDYCLLSDGTYGEIATQTPDVVIVMQRGAKKSYPTADFLAQSPRNLSQGFVADVSFGIDYAHQAESTQRIPAVMREALERGLRAIVPPEHVERVEVQFSAAAASSLDYLVLARFSGEQADKYFVLRRAIQRILVDTCSEHGWVIPFQQVTVWQAPDPAAVAPAQNAG